MAPWRARSWMEITGTVVVAATVLEQQLAALIMQTRALVKLVRNRLDG